MARPADWPADDPPWRVVGQDKVFLRMGSDAPVGGWRITFETRNGYTDTVEVANENYTPGKVANLVNAAAENIEAVHALQGPPGAS